MSTTVTIVIWQSNCCNSDDGNVEGDCNVKICHNDDCGVKHDGDNG